MSGNGKKARRIYFADKDNKILVLDLNGIFRGEDTLEKQYMRKIIEDILVNELTTRQQKIAALYFASNKDASMREVSESVDRGTVSVGNSVNTIKKAIAKNIGRYSVECIHIVDVTDKPEFVKDITRVYKKERPPKEEKTVRAYKEVYNEYEETIAFIESRIKQINAELKKPGITYLERGGLLQRKKMLEQELTELHSSAHKVTKYIY